MYNRPLTRQHGSLCPFLPYRCPGCNHWVLSASHVCGKPRRFDLWPITGRFETEPTR